jgi:hypothetical protein
MATVALIKFLMFIVHHDQTFSSYWVAALLLRPELLLVLFKYVQKEAVAQLLLQYAPLTSFNGTAYTGAQMTYVQPAGCC